MTGILSARGRAGEATDRSSKVPESNSMTLSAYQHFRNDESAVDAPPRVDATIVTGVEPVFQKRRYRLNALRPYQKDVTRVSRSARGGGEASAGEGIWGSK